MEYSVFGLVLLVFGMVYLVIEFIYLVFRMVCLVFGIKISPSHGLWEAPAAHVMASLAAEKHKDVKKKLTDNWTTMMVIDDNNNNNDRSCS